MANYIKFRKRTYNQWESLSEPRDPNVLFIMPTEGLVALGDELFTSKNAALEFTADKDTGVIVLKREKGDDLVIDLDLDKRPVLGDDGIIPSSQLPISIDRIDRYDTKDDFPTDGELNVVYKARDTNNYYRWDGEAYAVVSEFLSLGETASTAYRGDRGKKAYDERGSQIAGDWLTWQSGKLHVDHPLFEGVDGGTFEEYGEDYDYEIDGGEF